MSDSRRLSNGPRTRGIALSIGSERGIGLVGRDGERTQPETPGRLDDACVVTGALWRVDQLGPHTRALPGVVAMIFSLPIENGYLTYPIGHFAEERPPREQLVADRKHGHHVWRDQLGKRGKRHENDPWEFDRRPWLAQAEIRWTEPGSVRTKLAEGFWEALPLSRPSWQAEAGKPVERQVRLPAPARRLPPLAVRRLNDGGALDRSWNGASVLFCVEAQ